MTRKYIMINSLDHCRSTIVDLFLGQQLGLVSLGEVRRTVFAKGEELKNIQKEMCSCGHQFSCCTFWSEIGNNFFGYISSEHHTAIGFIDSSKDISHYRSCRLNLSGFDTFDILVYRKFSTWYPSVMKSRDREDRKTWKSIFRDKDFISGSLRLYLRKFRMIAWFEFIVTYGRFIFSVKRPVIIASDKDLYKFIEQFRVEGDTHGVQSHIARGNRIRNSKNIELQSFDETDSVCRFLRLIGNFKL